MTLDMRTFAARLRSCPAAFMPGCVRKGAYASCSPLRWALDAPARPWECVHAIDVKPHCVASCAHAPSVPTNKL